MKAGLGLVGFPRWHVGCFWFPDWLAGLVLAVAPALKSEVFTRASSLPLCIDWLPDGRLLVLFDGDSDLRSRPSTMPYWDAIRNRSLRGFSREHDHDVFHCLGYVFPCLCSEVFGVPWRHVPLPGPFESLLRSFLLYGSDPDGQRAH